MFDFACVCSVPVLVTYFDVGVVIAYVFGVSVFGFLWEHAAPFVDVVGGHGEFVLLPGFVEEADCLNALPFRALTVVYGRGDVGYFWGVYLLSEFFDFVDGFGG